MTASCPRIQLSGAKGKLDNYCQAVCGAGGFPVPGYAPEPDLTCDGLILCGGEDVDPALYGQENQGSLPPDPLRDRAELALFHAFFQAGKPIFGICRGVQVLNVALGGDLIQDLPPSLLPFHAGENQDLIHPIRSAEGTILHRLYGPVFPVNSWHHQAAGRLGHGLRAAAWAEGGFPEALVHDSRPVLGVQFHTERLCGRFRRPDAVDGAPLMAYFLSLCKGSFSAKEI